MRITNNIILHNTTGNINGNKVNVNNLNNQMTSQKKIQRPSENPVIAVRSLRLRTKMCIRDRCYNADDGIFYYETPDAYIPVKHVSILMPVSYTHLEADSRYYQEISARCGQHQGGKKRADGSEH